MKDMRAYLEGQIKDLRIDLENQMRELNTRFDKLESRLTIKLGLMLAAAVGLMSTLQALSH